jgi:hypothetical protein
MYLPPLLINTYSLLALSYSSLETARHPSLKGGCCALTDEGVNAISSAPASKMRKSSGVQSALRSLLIAASPKRLARRPVVLKDELIALNERHEPWVAWSGRFFSYSRGSFQPNHKDFCKHCDHSAFEPVQHSNN